MATFVLVHSPLVGPLTWSLVAAELERRGIRTVVPALQSTQAVGPPYWQQHVDAIARALGPVNSDTSLVLVAHSGAGVLLPAVRQITKRPIAAYIFVDTVIPEDGKSPLDLFDSPEAAEQFRQLAKGGLLPIWSDWWPEDALRALIPEPGLRQRFVAELRPLPVAVYKEAVPVVAGWPDAPCAYLRFSPAYVRMAEKARSQGWACTELEGGHFHMLVDAEAVTNALFGLTERLDTAFNYREACLKPALILQNSQTREKDT